MSCSVIDSFISCAGGSKLLGLPGPSALHVGLLTALRHTIFNWDSCNKDATKIVSTFQSKTYHLSLTLEALNIFFKTMDTKVLFSI